MCPYIEWLSSREKASYLSLLSSTFHLCLVLISIYHFKPITCLYLNGQGCSTLSSSSSIDFPCTPLSGMMGSRLSIQQQQQQGRSLLFSTVHFSISSTKMKGRSSLQQQQQQQQQQQGCSSPSSSMFSTGMIGQSSPKQQQQQQGWLLVLLYII